MQTNGLLKRCIVFVTGLFIMAFGVALSIKANLGTSPISSVPFIYSLGFPFSMGIITIIMHIVMILLQVIILQKAYKPIQLLQLVVALIFGYFTDLTLFLVKANVCPTNYFYQWILCILSIFTIAFGIFIEVKAKVTYLAGEGLVLAISKAFHLEFGKTKVWFDCSLVSIAIVSSFIFLKDLHGIREGTVASAVFVGLTVRFFNKKLGFVDRILSTPVLITNKTEQLEPNKHPMIITIGREYGSGGHQIGEIIAKELGFKFYDSKLIELSAKESGFTADYIKEHEQKLTSQLVLELYQQNYAYINEEIPPLDSLFMIQSKIIRDISNRESSVIVGRCADFVLKGNKNCFSIFIHADKDVRIKRIINEYGIPAEKAIEIIKQKDKERSNYCKYYTHKNWGKVNNYTLAIDSSVLGIDNSARLIIDVLRNYWTLKSKNRELSKSV